MEFRRPAVRFPSDRDRAWRHPVPSCPQRSSPALRPVLPAGTAGGAGGRMDPGRARTACTGAGRGGSAPDEGNQSLPRRIFPYRIGAAPLLRDHHRTGKADRLPKAWPPFRSGPCRPPCPGSCFRITPACSGSIRRCTRKTAPGQRRIRAGPTSPMSGWIPAGGHPASAAGGRLPIPAEARAGGSAGILAGRFLRPAEARKACPADSGKNPYGSAGPSLPGPEFRAVDAGPGQDHPEPSQPAGWSSGTGSRTVRASGQKRRMGAGRGRPRPALSFCRGLCRTGRGSHPEDGPPLQGRAFSGRIPGIPGKGGPSGSCVLFWRKKIGRKPAAGGGKKKSVRRSGKRRRRRMLSACGKILCLRTPVRRIPDVPGTEGIRRRGRGLQDRLRGLMHSVRNPASSGCRIRLTGRQAAGCRKNSGEFLPVPAADPECFLSFRTGSGSLPEHRGRGKESERHGPGRGGAGRRSFSPGSRIPSLLWKAAAGIGGASEWRDSGGRRGCPAGPTGGFREGRAGPRIQTGPDPLA